MWNSFSGKNLNNEIDKNKKRIYYILTPICMRKRIKLYIDLVHPHNIEDDDYNELIIFRILLICQKLYIDYLYFDRMSLNTITITISLTERDENTSKLALKSVKNTVNLMGNFHTDPNFIRLLFRLQEGEEE